MNTLFFITTTTFWMILLYHLALTFAGLYYRHKQQGKRVPLNHYPSLDVFIPCHNEGIVMNDTLKAMTSLEYPGDLNIYVMNDNSTDETGDIANEFAKNYPHIHHIRVPSPKEGEPKGKSRVLNYALTISNGEYFVVYDADNQPRPDAAARLMEATIQTKNAAGAVGTVRTLNAKHNLLTRFIAIEFQAFQLTMQSGRYIIHKTGSLPGTNMLLKRSILEEVGGYDPKALAEDAELTLRLTAAGYIIAVDPYSQTWEQEPQQLRTLVKQRTRWLQGNLYVLAKFFKTPSWWKGRCLVHLFYYVTMFMIFFALLISSNVIFVLGLLGLVQMDSRIPYATLWYLSYFIFTIQLVCAIWHDEEVQGKTVLATVIMYFTYSQLFIVLFFRGLFLIWKDKRNMTVSWDKTERVSINV